MTARNERAVRAVPGATSDQRDGVGVKPILTPHFDGLTPCEPQDQPRSTLGPLESLAPLRRQASGRSSGVAVSIRPSFSILEIPSGFHNRVNPEDALESFRVAQSFVRKLETHRGTLELLTLLYSCGPCTLYDVRKSVSVRQRALYGSLKVVLALRLVEAERLHSFPRGRTKTYRLSAKGRALMEPMMQAWLTLLRDRDQI